MEKRDKQLNMTQQELMEVKMKSLKKLEDPNLSRDETEEIEKLINLIDKALEELSKPSTKTGWIYRDWETDRKSTRLNSSHSAKSRMPSSA